METRTTKSVDVVIIGAGMAGLSAARALLRGGTTDLLVVEARDRIGGRIHTVTLEEEAEGKHVIDYGAQFIHGCDGNPVYEIAKEYDLVAEDKSDFAKYEKDDAEANSFFTPRGQMIDPGIVEEVLDVLDGIFLEADKFARENVPIVEETETIGTFVHREFYKYLRTKGDSDEVFQMKEGIFNWRLMLEKTDNACKSIYELSPWGWGEYVECSGVDHLDLKHGFQSILDVIKSEIPERYFCLRCPVQSIYWQPEVCKPVPFVKGIRTKQSEEGSSVHPRSFSDENDTDRPIHILTGTGQVIRANHVIVTASLGCLKRKAHTMFKPLLPSDKLAVIQRMGFGTVDKLILEFEKPFWDKDSHGLQFAWLTDEPFTLSCVENKYQEEYLRDEWYQGIQGFDTMYGLPNMLCGWIAGDEAELMETVPDAVVLDICHELLQRFTNNPELPKPIRLFRSKWHMSNYVWGSYSYMKYGNSSIDCDILAQPLLNKEIPRVMFAGEATHRQFFSTAHGALLSGEREANRVLEWHRKATKSASDVN